MKILKIRKQTYKGKVYNVEVEDNHNYFANNILVSNCHENSTLYGKHGNLFDHKWLDTLHPYCELAIGGGNPLAHPQLEEFLLICKEKKAIPSMTVNQIHFEKDFHQN